LFSNPFTSKNQFNKNLNPESRIVFVADLFAEDYVGGAELTTKALIDSCPFPFERIRSSELTVDLLEQGHDKFWVFGNFAAMEQKLIPSIVANLKYAVLEYDYKYCRYRSPEKHLVAESKECDCNNELHGKMVSAFLHGAQSIWWMSEKQQEHYLKLFPFLAGQDNVVLSSVFDDEFFLRIKQLRDKYPADSRMKWLVLGSPSWIKGTAAAEQWCQDNGKDYEVVWNVPYSEMLEKLAASRGLAFLPNGSDTCPRLVIEAKLLGCELHLNEHVQHAKEIWFDTEDMLDTESYLYAARERFWTAVKRSMEWKPTISAYTTAFNVERMGYPWRASIESMLGFSDEVIVLDGGSDDGSYGALLEWATKEPKLKVHQLVRDWKAVGFALLDGQQKAEARRLCSGDFCWQMDIDEVVHARDWDKIRATVQEFPRVVDLVALPVIEFWGDKGKVRVDVNPWKWRLSRNLPHITHGLPGSMRRIDENGQLRSLGSDGCDYIHSETLQPIPFGTFMSEEVEHARRAALDGNADALKAYEQWINAVAERAPVVYHYSWWNLERKICNYRDFWTDFWEDLYGIKREKTNMFFQKPWSEVTDAEIANMAVRLESELGGWIFHNPVDFEKATPHIKITIEAPEAWRGKIEY